MNGGWKYYGYFRNVLYIIVDVEYENRSEPQVLDDAGVLRELYMFHINITVLGIIARCNAPIHQRRAMHIETRKKRRHITHPL